MIKQGLVSWSNTQSDGTTHYEALLRGSFNIIRYGRYVDSVEGLRGEVAGALVKQLLILGKTATHELTTAPSTGRAEQNGLLPYENRSKQSLESAGRSDDNGAVPDSNNSSISGMETRKAMQKLLETKLVFGSGLGSHAFDHEDFALTQTNSFAARHFQAEVNPTQARKSVRHLGDTLYGPSAAGDEIRPAKRRRLENAAISVEHGLVPPIRAAGHVAIDSDLGIKANRTIRHGDDTLYANHAELDTLLLQLLLKENVRRGMGEDAADIYGATLSSVGLRPGSWWNPNNDSDEDLDLEDGTVSSVITEAIVIAVAGLRSASTETAIAPDDGMQKADAAPSYKASKDTETNRVSQDHGTEEAGKKDDSRTEHDSLNCNQYVCSEDCPAQCGGGQASARSANHLSLKHLGRGASTYTHLLALSQHPLGFLQRLSGGAQNAVRWTIPYRKLADSLQYKSILQTIAARHGSQAVRLVNILAEYGKLDEKTLCAMCLLREKEMRSRLAKLQKAGLLEVQEVPRDNARVPSRTTYLFFYDQERCMRKISEECYKTMLHCLQRLRLERQLVNRTLEKASRSDVIGNEDSVLGPAELAALQGWHALEKRLWVEICRLDESLALKTDFQ